MNLQIIKVRRDFNGAPKENCKENIGVKIGSFDCTANCPHNQNAKKEIQEHAFDLVIVRCLKKSQLNQLQIEI